MDGAPAACGAKTGRELAAPEDPRAVPGDLIPSDFHTVPRHYMQANHKVK